MEIAKAKINELIELLKQGLFVDAKTLHKNREELLENLNLYENSVEISVDNKKYLEILRKIANDRAYGSHIFCIQREYINPKQVYADLIQRVLREYDINKTKAVRIAIDSNSFETHYNRFKKSFYNACLYTEKLDDVLECVNEYKKKNKNKRKTYLDTNAFKTEDELGPLIAKIYNSGLSLLDYAFYNLIDNVKFANYFTFNVPAEFRKEADIILTRKNKTEGEIINIIKQINNDEIDELGYFEQTKLNPYYLRDIAKKNNLMTVQLSKFITRNSHPRDNELGVLNDMKATLVISSIEVSDEIKKDAYDYLVQNEIPINTKYYKAAIRKLVKSRY